MLIALYEEKIRTGRADNNGYQSLSEWLITGTFLIKGVLIDFNYVLDRF